MVLREISVMLEKEEGMRSLIGRFAKFTTLLPNLLPITIIRITYNRNLLATKKQNIQMIQRDILEQ